MEGIFCYIFKNNFLIIAVYISHQYEVLLRRLFKLISRNLSEIQPQWWRRYLQWAVMLLSVISYSQRGVYSSTTVKFMVAALYPVYFSILSLWHARRDWKFMHNVDHNVGCLFSASFDHKKTLSALIYWMVFNVLKW